MAAYLLPEVKKSNSQKTLPWGIYTCEPKCMYACARIVHTASKILQSQAELPFPMIF